jgi:tryptophan synthase alpha chain
MLPRDRISRALGESRKRPGPALVAFITAGYPTLAGFRDVLAAVAAAADAVEIGVPFTDPMADGVTIQRSSETAIKNGVSLRWILDELAAREEPGPTPILLMSYLNPLIAFGYERLAARAVEAGVSGFMVPDLPYEECRPLADALDAHGLALVQFVTPATPAARLEQLCTASQGFVYAVTRTGITGGTSGLPSDLASYLDRVTACSSLPVCAGFGVRSREQVELIGQHASGVIVGSALVEVLAQGRDPTEFLRGLRPQS